MVEALDLEGHERVLEIGTGSGYAAAVLAEIAGEVFTIERHAKLASQAEASGGSLAPSEILQPLVSSFSV